MYVCMYVCICYKIRCICICIRIRIWNVCGVCTNTPGICNGICITYVLNTRGTWNAHGIRMECVCDMYGMCMEYVWSSAPLSSPLSSWTEGPLDWNDAFHELGEIASQLRQPDSQKWHTSQLKQCFSWAWGDSISTSPIWLLKMTHPCVQNQ